MITTICLLIALALIAVLSLCVYELNRDYMSLKKAYCIHFVMEHFIDDWKKVATNYCKIDGIDKVDIDSIISRDDVIDWAIKLLYDRKDFMSLFQCTLYQRMIDYIEQKIKTDVPINGILDFKRENDEVVAEV